jgi:hypothetical protein
MRHYLNGFEIYLNFKIIVRNAQTNLQIYKFTNLQIYKFTRVVFGRDVSKF